MESCKYMLRSYPIIRPYIKEVNALFSMSPEELRKRNERRFLEIFQRAYDKSPFYHKLYTEAGIKKEDIKCLDDIKKLPVITKDMVRLHADEMLTVPRWKVIVANTSGTTGTPLRVYEDWSSIWRNQAYAYVTRKREGFTYGQPLVSLRGNLDKRDMMLKVHASNTLFFSSYNINPERIHYYYDHILAHKPVAIEGYPSSLYTLALMLRDAGLELYIPVAFTSSETLLDYQRELIEELLHTQIYDRYGMTERTIYLVESDDHKGYYEAPGYSINEYLEDGEICTSLINESFPMIRYRSNDIIELYDEKEIKRNKFAIHRIKRILGRIDDYLVGKHGEICQRLNQIAKKAHHCKAMQMIQTEKGKVSIYIVPDGVFSDEDKTLFVRAFEELVGVGTFDYSISLVHDIKDLTYTARGKFKMVINQIDQYNEHQVLRKAYIEKNYAFADAGKFKKETKAF